MIRNNNFNALGVQNAINFREMFADNNVYLWIGKQTEWDDDLVPPMPLNNAQDEATARDGIFYLKKLSMEDTILAIPKRNWEINTVYTPFSETDDNLLNKPFFVTNGSNNTYICMGNNDGALSTATPIGTSVNTIITADGYSWQFISDVSPPLQAKFQSASFQSIPQGSQKTINQINTENSKSYGQKGKNAALDLFAQNIIITTEIDLAAFSPPITHRQFGILVNPLKEDNTPLTDSEHFIGDYSTVDVDSGILLNLTNHSAIDSSQDSSEKIQIIIKV